MKNTEQGGDRRLNDRGETSEDSRVDETVPAGEAAVGLTDAPRVNLEWRSGFWRPADDRRRQDTIPRSTSAAAGICPHKREQSDSPGNESSG